MQKPKGVDEWDGYPMPSVPKDRPPLTKEEEDKIIEELNERFRQRRMATADKEEKRKAI